MRYLFICLAFISFQLCYTSSFGQNDWTKEQRNTLYDECVDYLRKFPKLSTDQKENLSLCYLDEVTKKYPATEYKEKIDIELRKIREATLSICSKNLGLVLDESATPIESTPNPNKLLPIKKENLVGRWKDENYEYWFLASGDCKVVSQTGERTMGTWTLTDRTLTMFKERNFKTVFEYRVLELSSQKFTYRTEKRNSDIVIATRITTGGGSE